MIIVNDILIILGSAIKEQIERKVSCCILVEYVYVLVLCICSCKRDSKYVIKVYKADDDLKVEHFHYFLLRFNKYTVVICISLCLLLNTAPYLVFI